MFRNQTPDRSSLLDKIIEKNQRKFNGTPKNEKSEKIDRYNKFETKTDNNRNSS